MESKKVLEIKRRKVHWALLVMEGHGMNKFKEVLGVEPGTE